MILETLVVSLVACGISNLLPLIDDSHNALHYYVVAFKFAIAICPLCCFTIYKYGLFTFCCESDELFKK